MLEPDRNSEKGLGERLFADLENPRWMYLKAALFLAIGTLSAALLLLDAFSLRTAALLALVIWSFCRLYYFAFYVIERYIDPSFRFAGLGSVALHLWCRRRRDR